MKLKLAKQAKKEPRKARFPWDIGLMFVQPIKYTLILQNIKIYNSERKSNAFDLQVFFKFSCKRMISLKLDLECLRNFFECKIQTVSYEILDLCIFYFDEIDPNEIKAMN